MTPAVLVMVLSMAAGYFMPGRIQQGVTDRSAGLDAAYAKPAPEVGLTGCLEPGPAPGTFILQNARQRTDNPFEKSGDYLVNEVAPLQLAAHVDHSVRLFGVIKETGAVPSVDSPPDASLPSLNAKELRMAAETCAPAADDESAEFEGDADASRKGGRIGFADLGSMPGWMMPPGYGGQSSLKSDLMPDLFAGVAGGYRIGLVTGASQKITVAGTSSSQPDAGLEAAGSTQTSGWSGPWPVDTSQSLLPSLGNVPAGAAGPTIAVTSAAGALGLSVVEALAPPAAAATPIANPEPASLLLLGSGLASLAIVARRRRARRSDAAAG
jgi:hypothetical protein